MTPEDFRQRLKDLASGPCLVNDRLDKKASRWALEEIDRLRAAETEAAAKAREDVLQELQDKADQMSLWGQDTSAGIIAGFIQSIRARKP